MKKAFILILLFVTSTTFIHSQVSYLPDKDLIKKNSIRVETVYDFKAYTDSVLIRQIIYDSLGNTISSKENYRNGQVTITNVYSYTFDYNNHVVNIVGLENDIPFAISKIKNDNKGNALEYYQLDTNNNVTVATKNIYNEYGLSESWSKKSNGAFFKSYKVNYNDIGLPVKTESYNTTGAVTWNTYNIYDKSQMLVRVDWEDKKGKRPSVRYLYNSKGQVIEKKYYRNDSIPENVFISNPWAAIEKYSYYANGLLYEYRKYQRNRLLIHTKRFYDTSTPIE